LARIVLHSAGYWGDVVPYVPIANELVARGHDVTYALPNGHHALLAGERFAVADSGNPFCPAAVADDAGHARLVERDGMRFGGAMTGRYYVHEWVLPYLRANVDALLRVGDGADLFFTHPTAAMTTRIAADALGVPMMTGHLFPMIPETARLVPKRLRRVLGLVVGDRQVNALRRELGLRSIAFNATCAAEHEGMPLLWSERFAPRTKAWWSSWVATGFTLWDGPAGRAADPAVDAWLDAGDPPVVVTFGSSSTLVAQQLFETLAVRLDDIGVRALFLTGDDTLLPAWLRERPDVFSFAPLTQVLPRALAIVHSGSHGTNAAALAAGTPSICVPFLIDQLWNAKRSAALGVGIVVKGRRRRAERVWEAVDTVLDPAAGYRARTRAFAASLDGEDGVRTATDLIEAKLA
jgi:UDP:flavonoid glycosyltransferase YjiC (YdhE family)